MKKLLTVLLTLCAVLFFACGDNNKEEKPATCDPACEENQECKCADNTCKCEDKVVDECKCEDGSACPEGGKDACVKELTCDQTCSESQECNCEADKCECKDKSAVTEKCDPAGMPACDTECKAGEEECICRDDKWQCVPVDKPAECSPACEDGVTKCECTMDTCACVPVTPVEECFCDEAKTVKCPEGGKDACAAPVTTCDPACPEGKECKCFEDKCDCADVNLCDGKSENEACGENMICKLEAEALVCKADDEPAPSEPAPAE